MKEYIVDVSSQKYEGKETLNIKANTKEQAKAQAIVFCKKKENETGLIWAIDIITEKIN